MEKWKSEIKLNSEELAMTPEEFGFIRKKLHLRLNDLGFLDKNLHRHTISAMINENPVNPVMVYQLLAERYCSRSIVDNLRKEYEQEKSKGGS